MAFVLGHTGCLTGVFHSLSFTLCYCHAASRGRWGEGVGEGEASVSVSTAGIHSGRRRVGSSLFWQLAIAYHISQRAIYNPHIYIHIINIRIFISMCATAWVSVPLCEHVSMMYVVETCWAMQWAKLLWRRVMCSLAHEWRSVMSRFRSSYLEPACPLWHTTARQQTNINKKKAKKKGRKSHLVSFVLVTCTNFGFKKYNKRKKTIKKTSL